MKKFRNLISISILTIGIFLFSSKSMASIQKPSILVVGSPGGGIRFLIDPLLKKKLVSEGYKVASLYYNQLTPGKLKLFNLIIMVHEPPYDGENAPYYPGKGVKEILSIKKMILRYVQKGGGLLVFFDGLSYASGTSKYSLNSFLKGLGAKVTRTQLTESNSKDIHSFPLMPGIEVFKTTNIMPNPVTEGVKTFWYPQMSGAMILNKLWDIVIKGQSNASFSSIYKSSPPLLAIKKYGKGRIALFMGLSSFYINNGYARVYQYGWCFNKGNGMKLFNNLFSYLGNISLKNHIYGGYKQGEFPSLPLSGLMPIKPYKVFEYVKPYPGIIGVYTNFSGKKYTVKDFVKKAKSLGLKFIIFTDNIKTKKAFEELKKQCAENTTKNFIAIPGVTFKTSGWDGVTGIDKGIAANINTWPPSGGTSFIMALLNCGNNGIYAALEPKKGALPPYNHGGFNSSEILSYRGKNLITHDVSLFKKLSATPGFNLLPIVSYRINNPDELSWVVKHGFKLYLFSQSVSKLPYTPQQGYVNGFVSNGPVIDKFWASQFMTDPWEEYVLWKSGETIHIHIKVKDKVPLKKIELISGRKIIRVFYPDKKIFNKVVSYPIAQDGSLYLIVKDINKHWAISTPIPTRNWTYWNHVGSDRMNDYHNPILPDKYGGLLYPNGKIYGNGGLVTFGYGWGNYLRFYLPVPGYAYAPQGYETGQISSGVANIQTFPTINGKQTQELNNVILQRSNPLDTADVTIMKEIGKYVEKNGKRVQAQYVNSKTQDTIFRYTYNYGYIILLVNERVKILKDINLKNKRGLNVVLLNVDYNGGNTFKYISWIAPDKKLNTVPIDFLHLRKPFLGKIGKGGYAVLWPDQYGLVGIYSLDKNFQFEINNGQVLLGYNMNDKILKQGTVLKGRFIVVEDGGSQGPQIMAQFNKLWGKEKTPLYQPKILSFGKSESKGYIVKLLTYNYGIRVKFPEVKFLPNNILPVEISGVNGNWSAGALNKNGEFYPGGVYHGKLYLGLNKWNNKEYFLGNPVICNNPNVIIEITKISAQKIVFLVHNPTAQKLLVAIKPSMENRTFYFIKKINLLPGQTKKININISRRNWTF
jgi:uncharacterized membrane protein